MKSLQRVGIEITIKQFIKLKKYIIAHIVEVCYTPNREVIEPGGLPSILEGLTLQTKERRAMLMCVTYSDLIQFGIFICTLVGLCYTIFKGKRK